MLNYSWIIKEGSDDPFTDSILPLLVHVRHLVIRFFVDWMPGESGTGLFHGGANRVGHASAAKHGNAKANIDPKVNSG